MLVASSQKARDCVPFAETAKGRRDDTEHSRAEGRGGWTGGRFTCGVHFEYVGLVSWLWRT
jgi:hypothetical protein